MSKAGSREGFWHLLSDDERDALADLGRVTAFPPKATMCVEGDPATHMYVLLAGWVKVITATLDGQELVLALRGQGDIIGELAEEGGYRTATVRTISMVRSLRVAHEAFGAFLNDHPGASSAYRRTITRRWGEAATALLHRATTNGGQRFAALLIELAERHGVEKRGVVEVELPLPQGELASLAGTSRATVARALHEWRKRGLIRTAQRHITITNMDSLRRIARLNG
jgi:CRP/FNR family transcriptional regulator, cyclic AMP receptor protein